MIDLQEVRDAFVYDPATGILRWKNCGLGRAQMSITGSLHGKSRRQVNFKQRMYMEHRLIWFIVYGEWPAEEIDHINRNSLDNRLCNLRLATRAENGRNRGFNRNNTSGYKGVHRSSKGKPWRATIVSNGVFYHLGSFDDPKEASSAYEAAAQKLHGEFCGALGRVRHSAPPAKEGHCA